MGSKPRILIIYTGGTIGMKHSEKGYVPDPDFAKKVEADIKAMDQSLIPEIEIFAFKELLDSSNMTPSDWNSIAKVIEDNKDRGFEGFIVLHGTDTMAFTASALTFMLDIHRPVIITGSQIPYGELRNDARENLITALMISARICRHPFIPEVLIYFDNKLLKGCRCTKVDATHFAAFDSPNYPPLAEVGVDFDLKKQSTISIKFNPDAIDSPVLDTAKAGFPKVNFLKEPPNGEEYNIGVIRLFPGISARYVREILKPPLKGLVLQAYGVGNGPTREKNPELFDVIVRAIKERNMIITAVTQCMRGTVIPGDYETSLPVLPGYDMTLEAALTKLYYLLYTESDLEKVKQKMQRNLKGELTEYTYSK